MDNTKRYAYLELASFALSILIIPSLSAAQDKKSASELNEVADWTPTPAMIEAARGSNPRFNMASRVLAAEYTGLSRADLGQARQKAIPLADLIKNNGRSVDEYLERTLKIAEGVLQLNIREGLVDQRRADSIRLIMTNNVRAMVYGSVDRSERHLAQPVLDFEIPVTRLSEQTDQLFTLGKALFKQNWVAAPSNLTDRDGLGPLFNANSCNACHFRDGRGRPESGGGPGAGLLVKLGIPKSAGGSNVEPNYGTQFQDLAVPGEKPEGKLRIQYEMIHGEYADGEVFELQRPIYRFEELGFGAMHQEVLVSPRVANHIIGLGLLESIPEWTLLELADPEDRDGNGISGRVHRKTDRILGTEAIGRFGWKAAATSVLQQTAAAFVNDMGITSNLFPVEPLSSGQAPIHSASHGGRPEISDEHLEAVAAYSSLLAVPPRRNIHDAVVERGERLFNTMNCIACHVSRLKTDDHPKFRELTAREIEPFTDLLLHDMGDELADGRPDGQATGVEWRTPPLWGIGLFEKINGHTFLLHDGRARNFAESILWHGGEAAASRDSFRNAVKEDRLALVKFLESL